MRNETAEKRRETERALDEAARLWKTTPLPGNEARVRHYRDQVFLLAFRLHGQMEDGGGDTTTAFLDAFEKALETFDPQVKPFSHYLSYLLKKKTLDASRYRRHHDPAALSLDAPLSSEDPSLTLGDTLAADPGPGEEFYGPFAELTALVLNFAQRRGAGPSASKARRMWYRLFYTEDMTFAMKQHLFRFLHERDIFQAMDLDYLDYYMTRLCRTGPEVMSTPLKPYRDVAPDRTQPGETPLPLQADVSLAFLQRCRGIAAKDSARSYHKANYAEEKRALLSSP